jgi:hypothetical protein
LFESASASARSDAALFALFVGVDVCARAIGAKSAAVAVSTSNNMPVRSAREPERRTSGISSR